MPCFSCKCFRDGKGRNGERLDGGRGYCELWDQEYWRGHECNDFAPTWYFSSQNNADSSFTETKGGFFSSLFSGRKKSKSSLSSEEEQDLFNALSDLFDSDTCDDDYDDGYDDDGNSRAAKELCARVSRNINVDGSIFNKYGLNFKHNLVVDCDVLQLNFELSNTRVLAKKMPRGDDFTIKANVYDKKGKLLHIEEVWVEFSQLKSGYAADFFYFSGDSMDKANSIKLYAVDPLDDYDEDEDIEEPGTQVRSAATDLEVKLVIVNRYNTILNESLELIRTTYNPQTFFGRYKDCLDFAKKIAEESPGDAHRKYAREILADLTNNRDAKIKAFIDRCYEANRLYSIKDELKKYEISDAVMRYVISLLQKIEIVEDAPESGEYIYCSLSFGGEGKTYYYKTTDETIQPGDDVVVLAGATGKKNIATVVKVERFKVGETPYPPNATKDIIGKCSFYN